MRQEIAPRSLLAVIIVQHVSSNRLEKTIEMASTGTLGVDLARIHRWAWVGRS